MPSYYTARPSGDLVVAAHQHITREWWEVHLTAYEVYVSELVRIESRRGDSEAAKQRMNAIKTFPVLRLTDEAAALARLFLKKLPIPEVAWADATHIALATVHRMDFLVTWNCRHMARGSVMKSLPQVAADAGFRAPNICTPEELSYENPNMD